MLNQIIPKPIPVLFFVTLLLCYSVTLLINPPARQTSPAQPGGICHWTYAVRSQISSVHGQFV